MGVRGLRVFLVILSWDGFGWIIWLVCIGISGFSGLGVVRVPRSVGRVFGGGLRVCFSCLSGLVGLGGSSGEFLQGLNLPSACMCGRLEFGEEGVGDVEGLGSLFCQVWVSLWVVQDTWIRGPHLGIWRIEPREGVGECVYDSEGVALLLRFLFACMFWDMVLGSLDFGFQMGRP